VDLWATIRIAVRRWYVTLPILLICGGATASLVASMPVTYRTSASIVVLASSSALTQQPSGNPTLVNVNPYTILGGSQNIAAAILQTKMESDEVRRRLQSQGVRSDWSLVVRAGVGPVLDLTISHAESAAALRDAETILQDLEVTFAKLQTDAGSPDSQRIQISSISAPQTPRPQYGSKVRLGMALAVVGLGLAVGCAFSVEGISRGRKRRHAARVAAPEADSGSLPVPQPDRPEEPAHHNAAREPGTAVDDVVNDGPAGAHPVPGGEAEAVPDQEDRVPVRGDSRPISRS
jgi:hypothetical protein